MVKGSSSRSAVIDAPASSKVSGSVVKPGENSGVDTRKALVKLQALRKELYTLYPERESVIDGILVAILSRRHAVLLGDPGTGKTSLNRAIGQCLGLKFFSKMLTQQMPEDVVLGPPDMKAYLDPNGTGDLIRRIKDRLADCDHAYLDEGFKCNQGTLNALLQILEERIIENPDVQQIPLMSAIISSNEGPEDESLMALWNRLALRYWVKGLQKFESELALAKMMRDNDGKLPLPKTRLTREETIALQDEVRLFARTTENGTLEALIKLKAAAKGASIANISDRSVGQAQMIIAAYAYLNGEPEIDESSFVIVANCWANEEDDVEAIKRLITLNVNQFKIKLEDARTRFNDLVAGIKPQPPESADSSIKIEWAASLATVAGSLKTLTKELNTIREQDAVTDRKKQLIDNVITEVNAEATRIYKLSDSIYPG